MKRALKILTIVVGVLVVLIILAPLRICFVGGWGCPDMADPIEVAERESIQTSILAFMVDNDLAEVTPTTSDAGGKKINGTGIQFHATLDTALHEPSRLSVLLPVAEGRSHHLPVRRKRRR